MSVRSIETPTMTPCPFCHTIGDARLECPDGGGGWWIRCQNCLAAGPSRVPAEEARAEWEEVARKVALFDEWVNLARRVVTFGSPPISSAIYHDAVGLLARIDAEGQP